MERDLDITSNIRFDVQIEGAKCEEYTVNEVYGLVDEAWKDPAALKFPIERPLDDLIAEAREKATEKNLNHMAAPAARQSPQMEL